MGAGEVRPGEIAAREVDAGEVFACQVGADEVAVEIDSIIVAEAGCERGKTRQRLWLIELLDFGWVHLRRVSGRLLFSGLPLLAPVGRVIAELSDGPESPLNRAPTRVTFSIRQLD